MDDIHCRLTPIVFNAKYTPPGANARDDFLLEMEATLNEPDCFSPDIGETNFHLSRERNVSLGCPNTPLK